MYLYVIVCNIKHNHARCPIHPVRDAPHTPLTAKHQTNLRHHNPQKSKPTRQPTAKTKSKIWFTSARAGNPCLGHYFSITSSSIERTTVLQGCTSACAACVIVGRRGGKYGESSRRPESCVIRAQRSPGRPLSSAQCVHLGPR